jgi:hypothetical protein
MCRRCVGSARDAWAGAEEGVTSLGGCEDRGFGVDPWDSPTEHD